MIAFRISIKSLYTKIPGKQSGKGGCIKAGGLLLYRKDLYNGNMESSNIPFTPYQHAVMFGLFAKNILEVFGKDEGDTLLFSAVGQYGEERGRRMAKRCAAHGKPLDMDGYQAFAEWRYNREFEKIPLFNSPYSAHRVLQCPWVNSWKKAGLMEYGQYYCRAVDFGIVRGFNPKLSLEMPGYLSKEGAEYCEFHWKDLVVDENQTKRVAAISAEIGGSCVRDFVYHTAHLYRTLSDCAAKQDSAKGKEAALRTRKAFMEKCSDDEWRQVEALINQDFSAI
jgi:hypothetical protein